MHKLNYHYVKIKIIMFEGIMIKISCH